MRQSRETDMPSDEGFGLGPSGNTVLTLRLKPNWIDRTRYASVGTDASGKSCCRVTSSLLDRLVAEKMRFRRWTSTFAAASVLRWSASPAVSNFRYSEIPLDPAPKSPAYPSPSCPTEGRIRIVRDAGRDAVDAAASGVTRDGRAGSRESVSDQRRADERRHARRSLGEDGLLRTAKSCGPDASWLASSPAEAKPAQPGVGQPSSAGRR